MKKEMRNQFLPRHASWVGRYKLKHLKQLNDLLEAGFMQPSKASHGAPIFLQRKVDGSLRICINYHALTKVTIKNK